MYCINYCTDPKINKKCQKAVLMRYLCFQVHLGTSRNKAHLLVLNYPMLQHKPSHVYIQGQPVTLQSNFTTFCFSDFLSLIGACPKHVYSSLTTSDDIMYTSRDINASCQIHLAIATFGVNLLKFFFFFKCN